MGRLDEPTILKKLSYASVFELTPGERLKVMNCLITQILTYASIRDEVEDVIEKVKTLKNDLKNLQKEEAQRKAINFLKKKEKNKPKVYTPEQIKQMIEAKKQGGKNDSIPNGTIENGIDEDKEKAEKEKEE